MSSALYNGYVVDVLCKGRFSVSGTPLQDNLLYAQRERALVLHPDHIDDSTLWDAFRSGDEKALVHIFDRYANPLFNYGRKIATDDAVVKDAVQELFIVIWKQRRQLGDTDCIKSYLFKSLRRRLVRSLSRIKDKLFSPLSSTSEYIGKVVPSHEVLIIARQISEEKRAHILKMMERLTRRQQEVLFLRYFEEMSCDEIAEVMGLSRQAVYNLVHKALRELRAAYQ